ncbi:MAG: GNAT family N-acetyltransferase [Lachnospiraceae bacterium]|jgi:GNAT superfamily N-acetyltransferase|nr:GNAT family N-acetyltransferase [Lachnospiraceae bacterium]
MEYRKANVNDVNVLVNLRKQQLLDEGEVFENNIDNDLHKYFSENIMNNKFIAWLAIENNEIIATSGLCFYELPPTSRNPSGKIAYITNMFTKNEFRRKGIATKLFEKIIDEIKLLNIKVIRLHTSVHGKELYKEFGFVDSEGFMHLRL